MVARTELKQLGLFDSHVRRRWAEAADEWLIKWMQAYDRVSANNLRDWMKREKQFVENADRFTNDREASRFKGRNGARIPVYERGEKLPGEAVS